MRPEENQNYFHYYYLSFSILLLLTDRVLVHLSYSKKHAIRCCMILLQTECKNSLFLQPQIREKFGFHSSLQKVVWFQRKLFLFILDWISLLLQSIIFNHSCQGVKKFGVEGLTNLGSFKTNLKGLNNCFWKNTFSERMLSQVGLAVYINPPSPCLTSSSSFIVITQLCFISYY